MKNIWKKMDHEWTLTTALQLGPLINKIHFLGSDVID